MRMTQTKVMESKKSCNESREVIHSGQFMLSNIEQEDEGYMEVPDYVAADEGDDEIEEIVDTTKLMTVPSGVCTQLERYNPQTVATCKHYEIDSDLSQVFNTLNVTYK